MMCSKCKQRPAVIFIQRVENGQTTPSGYCLKCAMEMNLGPIKQMMENMGITEDDYEAMSEQFGAMMGMGDNGEGFEPGGEAAAYRKKGKRQQCVGPSLTCAGYWAALWCW